MSLLRFFSGKTVADLERKADNLAETGAWGKAKIAYDHALDKLEKSPAADSASSTRLHGKIARCKEALAAQHTHDAGLMMESGAFSEAKDLVLLALELSADAERRSGLERLLEEIDAQSDDENGAHEPLISYEEPDESQVFATTDTEVLQALYGTLPEEVQAAYLTYGENFAAGYQALNTGDFETAVDCLSLAMEEAPSPDSYIPLELATAYLNLGRHPDARQLLESFVDIHPHVLPAYQMLCEIYWEGGEFGRAEDLLAGLPPVMAESVSVYLLKGETLVQAGDYETAERFYNRFIQDYGWNDKVAMSLAETHEARSETEKALNLYGEMMSRCTGCGSRIDPEVKRKYADLSYAAGERTASLLELYLSLAREMPRHAAEFYDKVSRIYAARGNTTEERRFRSFSSQARAGSQLNLD